MARLKLSEYRAKSLFLASYDGVSLNTKTLDTDIASLDDSTNYIIKVDQGIKKRGKQGLIRLGVSKSEAKQAVEELAQKGFTRFIAETVVPHDDQEERYVSFESTREGIVIHYSEHGGVDIEDNPDSIEVHTTESVPLPQELIYTVTSVMQEQHLSFVEINPLVVRDNQYWLLDAAVLADSAGEFMSKWSEDDVVEAHTLTTTEQQIAEMNQNSPAAFSFRVLNPDGALWLLLSGGGASITIADEAMNQGMAGLIGNYGEYSGGPTTEETYLYTTSVLSQMFHSQAPKKCLIIAGGVANFTDVKKTFAGVIKALQEHTDELTAHNVKVYVRRGGPNETEGLSMMKTFLNSSGLYGSVHGSDMLLTDVINEALEYINE